MINYAALGKTMGNVRKHTDIKLYTTEKKKLFGVRNKLSYYEVSHRKSIGYKNEKRLMNKPFYLGLSILQLNKT